jgi:FkbH-like protein
VHLQDKFGDNGMISVVICTNAGDCRKIETWLASCRVIKRRVEEAVCDKLVSIARSSGVEKIRGYYRATEKNKLARNHYLQLGFELIS